MTTPPLDQNRNPSQNSLSRRRAISVGGLGMLGLTMPRLLQAAQEQTRPAPPVKAKSVVFLYQFGGPSHLETFDMKPEAPDGIRSHFGTIASSLPGLRVCEHLPKTAQVMHKVTLVRSMQHTMKNHNSASYYALTGKAPPVDDIRLQGFAGTLSCLRFGGGSLKPSNQRPAHVRFLSLRHPGWSHHAGPAREFSGQSPRSAC